MSAGRPHRVAASLVPGGSVLSIAGVRAGSAQRTDRGWLTGTTVLVPPPHAVGGADVRGGGPATHETDLLAPGTHAPGVDAVVLTGGSAWGLAAVGGVQRGLAEDGRGFPAPQLPGAFVPIVPGAAVYDLGRGDGTLRTPDAELGLAAYRAATGAHPVRAQQGPGSAASAHGSSGGVPDTDMLRAAEGGHTGLRGSAGAGTGAHIGRGLLRGGLGTVCLQTPDGHRVGVLVAANPMGDVLEPSGRLHAAGVLARLGTDLPHAPSDWVQRALEIDGSAHADASLRNTTVAIIVTDASLDSAQTTRLAQSAQAGLARAVHPSHTLGDGDTVFALSAPGSAQPGEPSDRTSVDAGELFMLNVAAADALSLAIVDAALSAARHAASLPDPVSGAPLPRPAALAQIAPDLAQAWRQLREEGV